MVLNVLRRKPVPQPQGAEVKVSAAAQIASRVLPTGGAQAVWGARDGATLTRSGFLGNPVGHRTVKLIAEAAASLPLVLQDDARRYDSHPLLRLLARPNGAQGRAELLEAIYAHLLLSGNAYIEAVAGDAGLPVELHVLRPDRMRVVPGADGWPVGYDYTVGAKSHRFPNDPMRPAVCHLRAFHPLDDHYGAAPLQAAATAVEVHNAAARWSKSLLDNAARPSGALVWRGNDNQGLLADDQFRRLSEEIEANFQGARNAGRPMVLEGGLDWKPMGFSPSDMEFHRTKESAAREIAQAFGVPPMLLGIPGDATYANYQEANRAFYRLTVLPLVARVTAALADWLTLYSGEVLELKPDLDQVQALASERDAQWRRVAEAEFLTVAEKRRLLGLPALSEDSTEGGADV
ncbi:phage portal protein, HK97 family [Tritonibacter multivorans]|uniref:Phage portal protein, HK97 family n=1 Tax=Tritonibacter multivorans TaxID=928856 RepID=A0A0P1GIF1_9RHOB|nr:phage portal protein [Tritonibacter multivorans]MDA7420433.1 phage portal protein [Tritonibacter multivorans]CUH81616.1 phage portal protein, HK97 family [Tritonibacter multivorans]SFC39343.1 phage portal protein, HK97 family [Tritonibacter multivorans]